MNRRTRVNNRLSILALLLGLLITGTVLTTPAVMLLADADNYLMAGPVEPDHG